MKILTTFAICLMHFLSIAQTSIIKDIAPNSGNGLTNYFLRSLDPIDSNLFFIASTNGLKYNLWKTDGTIDNTSEILTPGKISSLLGVHFSKKGIYLEDYKDNFRLLFNDGKNNDVTVLDIFNGLPFSQIYNFGDRSIFFDGFGKTVFVSDGTNSGSKVLVNLEDDISSFTRFTSNDQIGIISDSKSIFFIKQYPLVVELDGTVSPIKSYLSDTKTFDIIYKAFIFRDLIFLSVKEDGNNLSYIYDTIKKTYHEAQDFGDIIKTSYINGKYILYTDYGTYFINESTKSYERVNFYISNGIDPILYNNKAYLIGEYKSNPTSIVSTNGTISGTKIIPGTDLGNDIVPEMYLIGNKIYFTSEQDSKNTLLKVVNLSTGVVSSIDKVVDNYEGNEVLSTGIELVKNVLIITKYDAEFGHEMYKLDPSTDTKEILKPNNKLFKLKQIICENTIEIESLQPLESFEVLNNLGKTMVHFKPTDNFTTLDISDFVVGQYYILASSNGKNETLKFLKL